MKCFTLTQNRQGRDATLAYLRLREEPYVRVGAPGNCMKVPIREPDATIVQALKRLGERETHVYRADLVQRVDVLRGTIPTLIPLPKEGGPMDDECLVHVDFKHDGQYWFEANTYDEIVYEDRRQLRVRRAYRPFTEAEGIHVLAYGSGPHGEPQALFHMCPGSSFRICRDTIDRTPALVIAWPGTNLKVITPHKYKKAMKQMERETA